MTDRAAAPATVRELDADAYAAAIPGLAALLVDAVDGGAGVSFLAGVTTDEAAAWWTERIGPRPTRCHLGVRGVRRR